MTTQITTTGGGVAQQQPASYFNDDQIALIKQQICPGATNLELDFFLETCRRTGLDPIARQIYSVPRNQRDKKTGQWVEKRTVQVSIDGFRLLAERSGKYLGQTPAEWCGKDGKWVDVWLVSTPPAAARIGVHKQGAAQPTYAVATYTGYCQLNNKGEPMGMWAKMPDVMLSKCAEALALRKAFPAELSGLYTAEEMQQSENETVIAAPVTATTSQPVLTPEIQASEVSPYNAPMADGIERVEAEVATAVHRAANPKAPRAAGSITEEQAKDVSRTWARRYCEVTGVDECDWGPLNEIVKKVAGVDRNFKIPASKLDAVLSAIAAYGSESQPVETVEATLVGGTDDIPF